MEFPGKNTGVGCHFHLQGIFPTRYQTSVSCKSPAFQADSLLLSHQGSQVNGYTTANQTKIFLPLIYIFYIVSVSSGFSTTLKIFV